MVLYNGIELEVSGEDVAFAHSRFMETDRNTDFSDALRDMDASAMTPDEFRAASRLNSVINLNYQVTNGGIDQYFYNGYDAGYVPDSGRLSHVDKDGQVEELRELAMLAPLALPDGVDVGKAIIDLANDLRELENTYDSPQYYEVDEDVDQMEAAYEAFDDRYYKVSDRIEALVELRAQYLVKSFGKAAGEDTPTLAAESRDMAAGCGRLSQAQGLSEKDALEKASDR